MSDGSTKYIVAGRIILAFKSAMENTNQVRRALDAGPLLAGSDAKAVGARLSAASDSITSVLDDLDHVPNPGRAVSQAIDARNFLGLLGRSLAAKPEGIELSSKTISEVTRHSDTLDGIRHLVASRLSNPHH